jgi:hypothetical protein
MHDPALAEPLPALQPTDSDESVRRRPGHRAPRAQPLAGPLDKARGSRATSKAHPMIRASPRRRVLPIARFRGLRKGSTSRGCQLRLKAEPLPVLRAVAGHWRGADHRPSCMTTLASLISTREAFSKASAIKLRLASNRASRSSLAMLPVATTRSRRGRFCSRWLSRKSRSLCDHHAVLAVGDVRKPTVAGSIAVWQAGGMDTVVISFGQQVGQPQRELSIDQEFHAAASGTTRCPPAASAANSRAASTKSR